MLEKTSGAVGCFHCQTLGADETCPICSRPVCARCAEGDTCPVPHRRQLRLGLGKRLRSVCPDGTRGVVSGWTGGTALVDLTRKERIAPLAMVRFGAGTGPWPMMATAGRLAAAAVTMTGQAYMLVGAPEGPGMHQVKLPEVDSTNIEKLNVNRLAISEDGSLGAAVRSDLTVDLVDLAQPELLGTVKEQGEAVQSAALSAGLDLLALGLYGRLRLYRVSDRQRLGTLSPRDLDGDVAWVGFSRGRLATVAGNGRCLVYDIRRSDSPSSWPRALELDLMPSSSAADVVGEQPRGTRRVVADLSPDGSLLAVRQGKRWVKIFPVAGGEPAVLEGHTDRVCLIKFVRDGKVLVTADYDNRVFYWPRAIIEPPEPART